MIEEGGEKERREMEEERKRKMMEQGKTDIFKHTFVDAENLEVD